MVRTRSRYGVADHVGNAAFAALIACLACDRVPFWKRPSTRLVSAGVTAGEGAGGHPSFPSAIIRGLFSQSARSLLAAASLLIWDYSCFSRFKAVLPVPACSNVF